VRISVAQGELTETWGEKHIKFGTRSKADDAAPAPAPES
jgi:hypothetical protein